MKYDNTNVQVGDWLLMKSGIIVQVSVVLKQKLDYFYAVYKPYGAKGDPHNYFNIVKKVSIQELK